MLRLTWFVEVAKRLSCHGVVPVHARNAICCCDWRSSWNLPLPSAIMDIDICRCHLGIYSILYLKACPFSNLVLLWFEANCRSPALEIIVEYELRAICCCSLVVKLPCSLHSVSLTVYGLITLAHRAWVSRRSFVASSVLYRIWRHEPDPEAACQRAVGVPSVCSVRLSVACLALLGLGIQGGFLRSYRSMLVDIFRSGRLRLTGKGLPRT
jgi:hypothetical protein